MNIVITEIVEDHYSIDKGVLWLKCRTSSGNLIVFWGELGEENRNIASIRNQKLPAQVELLEPEECIPSDWEKSKYKLSYSVPLYTEIVVNPDY